MTTPHTRPISSGYAPVNGLELYYEVHGEGDPLILLHGGFGTAGMFAALLPILASRRRVIGVDLQAHGHTADIDRPLRLDLMAADIVALLDHLDIERAALLGYSMGGGVALQTAIQNPNRVSRLVVLSAPAASAGWYDHVVADAPLLNARAAAAMKATPMYDAYANTAPHPEDWPRLVAKMSGLLSTEYDWTANLPTITAPTLIAVGDADFVRLDHAVEMYRRLGGGQANVEGTIPPSQLAILPGTSHYTSFQRADLLAPILTAFLQ